ncbi:hypothetical protein GF373_01745, partial [bacterium]|nr:hypothetical protein [bacterium]
MSFWDQIAKEKHLLDYPDTPHGPVGFMYPNQYSVGMACLGYQQVYRLMRNAGLSVERVFYDKKRRETRSIENHTPLFRFPFLAASYIYELDIIHLIQMMLHGGVEPLRENRWDDGPLLLLGGTAATANPPLVSRIADAVVLGESEYTIDKIAEIFKQHASLGKKEMLEKLAELNFVYVPAIHGVFDKEVHASYALEPIDAVPCHSAILAESDEFHGAFLLELSRGCKYRCKFCVVHY